MKTERSKTTDEARIRKLIEDRVQAVDAKDVNRLMSNHAPDIVLFDVVDPLQYTGAATVRKRAEEWFALYQSASAMRSAIWRSQLLAISPSAITSTSRPGRGTTE